MKQKASAQTGLTFGISINFGATTGPTKSNSSASQSAGTYNQSDYERAVIAAKGYEQSSEQYSQSQGPQWSVGGMMYEVSDPTDGMVFMDQDQGGGNIYNTNRIPFSYHQAAYLPVEGVGLHGSYHAKGAVTFSNSSNGVVANISATGLTTAGQFGDVNFGGNVSLVVNGQVQSTQSFQLPSSYIYETGTYPLGSTSFLLPQNGSVSLQLQIGYSFSAPEGRSVPMPGTMSRTISIPVYNRPIQYLNPEY